jgi:DNA-binding MarR family transcriptional regulator
MQMKNRRKIQMIIQKKATVTIRSDDVEERGQLADRVLFWLLKHPYQHLSDLSFIFQVHPSTICRHLQTLTTHALVESLTAAIVSPSRPEALYSLTTAGIERVADLIGGADPARLARMWKANEAELLHLLPRLASAISLQEAVLRLIADAPRQLVYPGGYPAAIRWHWQRDYLHTFERKQKQMTFRADGVVVFRRRPLRQETQGEGAESWYCVLWFVDPGFCGSEDLRLMRTRLEHLLLWRESSERWSFYRAFPPLLVLAPTTHQRDLWIYCAQEAAAHLRVAPLKGACAMREDDSPWRFLWHSLDGSGQTTLQLLVDPLIPQAIPPGLLAPRQMEPGTMHKHGRKDKVVIGNFETRAKLLETKGADLKSMTDISLLSLSLSHRHMNLLQQIYALPLIAPHELAALLRREEATQRRYLSDLHHVHCLETMATARAKRLILTETGLRLIAAMLGVHLAHIAERKVSTHHWQQRGVRQALQTIEHTAGIYTFLAQLQIQAQKIGQELLWWETTRSFRRYHLQGAWHNLMPDALFEYQTQEAWLEWDTGSMHQKPLRRKFEAYAHYVRSQQYRHEHKIPPTLLVVTPHYGREQSLRHVAASVLGSFPLRVWTTTEQLFQVQGPLAAIWRPLGSRGEIEEDGIRSTWIA